jgi:hypothetical protein
MNDYIIIIALVVEVPRSPGSTPPHFVEDYRDLYLRNPHLPYSPVTLARVAVAQNLYCTSTAKHSLEL